MKWSEFNSLLKDMIDNGYLTEHKIYSDDGKNEYLETHYKVNYGKVNYEYL